MVLSVAKGAFLMATMMACLHKSFLVSGECTDCGLCYNHGGNYKCLTEYSPTCDKWHASFDCPPGVPCETTNDPEKARPCSLEGTCSRCDMGIISADNCCTPTKDGSTYSPTPVPVESDTWSEGQSKMLPAHQWVVIDHNDGPEDSSFGIAVAVSDEHVYIGGKTTSTMTMKNPMLENQRIAVQGVPLSEDGDMFLTKVTLAGEPVGIHMFTGSEAEQPNGLAVSKDGKYLSMVGYFRGTLTLGKETYNNGALTLSDGSDCGSNCPKDGFLVKLDAVEANVMWSKHFMHDGDKSTEILTTDITENGEIVYGGHIANTGRLGVLDNKDGATVWESIFGESVGPFTDVKTMTNGQVVAVGSLQGSEDFGGDVGVLSSAYTGSREALVLVFDPKTGTPKWAALMGSPYQYARSSKGVLCATAGDDIYVACSGPCNNVQVSNNASAGGMKMASNHKGAVAKFSASGEPQWISEVPTQPQGLAAMEGSHVYVSYYEDKPIDYGDATFLNWKGEDTKDQFIIKFDSDSGKGQWVMQQGGTGKEYVRRMAMDKYGDIYTTGKTGSNPGYFDNIQMTSHDNSNKNDMFVAKMTTSDEVLPSCMCDKDTVKAGHCFIQNTCFKDGADIPPGEGEKCVAENVECKVATESSSSISAVGAVAAIPLFMAANML